MTIRECQHGKGNDRDSHLHVKTKSFSDVSQHKVVLLLAGNLVICVDMFYCHIWNGALLIVKERAPGMLLNVLYAKDSALPVWPDNST